MFRLVDADYFICLEEVDRSAKFIGKFPNYVILKFWCGWKVILSYELFFKFVMVGMLRILAKNS